MAVFSVAGFTAGTGAAGVDESAAALWYPSGATVRLHVYEVYLYKSGLSGGRAGLIRTTTRGTPGSTVTPDGDNNWSGTGEGPRSAAVLDMANFSVEPTVAAPYLYGTAIATATGAGGSGHVWVFPQGIEVPPNSGLAIAIPVASSMNNSWVGYVWEEDS